MAAQFDVFRTTSNSLVVVLQNDLLSGLRTRAVAFLAEDRPSSENMGRLTPVLELDGKKLTLEAHTIATLTQTELGDKIGSLASHRDQIIRAFDALLSGV